MLLLAFQFYLTDAFLGYKFSLYGWESIVYYSFPYKDRQSKVAAIRYKRTVTALQY